MVDPITALKIIFYIATGVASYKSYKKAKKLEKQANQLLIQKYGTGGGIPVAYGTRRIAGTVLYANTVNNRELFVVYALCVGEIQNISNIKIGGRPVSDRTVFDHHLQRNSNYYGSTTQEINNILANQDPPSKPRMVFNCHMGEDDQAADPMLVGCLTEWTSAHRLKGIAYIAANFDYDSGGGMFRGLPEITCDIQGKKLYDPRLDSTVTNGSGSHRIADKSTYEFTNNSPLVLLDYLTNTEYGKAIPTSSIDMQSFMDAADKNTTQQTITHSATVVRLSDDDTLRFENTSANADVFNAIKIGNQVTVAVSGTTYASGTVIGKSYNQRLDSFEKTYGESNASYSEPRLTINMIQLSEGAVTTTIGFTETPVTISVTETQDRFPFNGVIDTEETLFDNTKKILSNMRGIFTYTNGKYSLKIEDAEAVTLAIDDDDILDSGIKVSIENKEEKYNIVEVEFANAQKDYELDTIIYKHTSETVGQDYKYDDNGEELKLVIEMPFVTNANLAYQNAKASLLRSRNNKSISFTGTHKLLNVKVGELISVTNSQLGLSAEQYRVTKLSINHNLTVNVNAVIYQSDIYGYVTPPTENITIPDDLIDSFKADAPTSLNFVAKNTSTGVQPYLTWTDSTEYPSYEFRVVIKDSGGNVKYDGRTKNTFFNLTGIEVANGYVAEVSSLNTNYVESDATTYTFNNSVPPVQTGDLGDDAVTNAKIAVDAIQGDVIAAGAITESKIGSDAVTTAKLANDAVTADIIAANAVTTTEIADSSISTPKIVSGAITAGTISTGAVTADKVLANAITAGKIASGAVTTDKLDANAVTAAKIAANTITASQIAAGTVTATEIASNTITGTQINTDLLNVKHFDNVSTDIKSHLTTETFVPLLRYGEAIRGAGGTTTYTGSNSSFVPVTITQVRNNATYTAVLSAVLGDVNGGRVQYSLDNSTWTDASGGESNIYWNAGTYRGYVYMYQGQITTLSSTQSTVYWRVYFSGGYNHTHMQLHVTMDNTT